MSMGGSSFIQAEPGAPVHWAERIGHDFADFRLACSGRTVRPRKHWGPNFPDGEEPCRQATCSLARDNSIAAQRAYYHDQVRKEQPSVVTPTPGYMTTYRYADGTPLDVEHLEDITDGWLAGAYFEVVEERWGKVAMTLHKFGRRHGWCDVCDVRVELDEPTPGPVWCAEHGERPA